MSQQVLLILIINLNNIGTQSELPISIFNNVPQRYNTKGTYQYTARHQDVRISSARVKSISQAACAMSGRTQLYLTFQHTSSYGYIQ